jgi:hypothetical protein
MSRTLKINPYTHKIQSEDYCRCECFTFGRRMKAYTKNGIRGKIKNGSGSRSITLMNNSNRILKKQARYQAKQEIINELNQSA